MKTLLGANFLTLVLSAPILNKEVHCSKFLTHAVGVGTWLVYFVNSKYHRYVSCLSVCDSLLCSRHHGIIGSNDNDSNVSNLCTTGTHGSKCLVSRSVEEGYLTTILKLNVVGTNVLCNTTCLTGNNVGLAYIVEQ